MTSQTSSFSQPENEPGHVPRATEGDGNLRRWDERDGVRGGGDGGRERNPPGAGERDLLADRRIHRVGDTGEHVCTEEVAGLAGHGDIHVGGERDDQSLLAREGQGARVARAEVNHVQSGV